jgi:hypothetical protein
LTRSDEQRRTDAASDDDEIALQRQVCASTATHCTAPTAGATGSICSGNEMAAPRCARQ